MMYTTLNKIREHDPCTDSWEKLLKSLDKTEADDESLAFEYILDELGLEDCLWATRSAPEYDKQWRLFACDCAEAVLHIFEKEYPNDKRPRETIEVARKYAEGEASYEELVAASDATRAAAWAAWAARDARDARAAWAARSAACDAARAAWAAGAAAGAAAWDAARATQIENLRKYLRGEKGLPEYYPDTAGVE